MALLHGPLKVKNPHMNILHISSSPRGRDSESRRLSLQIVNHLTRANPGATVVERELGQIALPHIDSGHAAMLGGAQPLRLEPASTGTLAISEVLIRELESADAVVIGTPMHNFSAPASLKVWIDHVVRVGRTFDVGMQGKIGRLRDRPVLIAVASGGVFSGENARQPDFLTPYLRAVLAVVGLRDVSFFTVEGTGAGIQTLGMLRSAADRAVEAHLTARY